MQFKDEAGKNIIATSIRRFMLPVAEAFKQQLDSTPLKPDLDVAEASLQQARARRAIDALNVCGHLEATWPWCVLSSGYLSRQWTEEVWFDSVVKPLRDTVASLGDLSCVEAGEKVVRALMETVKHACQVRTAHVPSSSYCILLTGLPAMGCWLPQPGERFAPSLLYLCDEQVRPALEYIPRLMDCLFASCCSLESLRRPGGGVSQWCSLQSLPSHQSDWQYAWQPRVLHGSIPMAHEMWKQVGWSSQDLLKACVECPGDSPANRIRVAAGALNVLVPGISAMDSSYTEKLKDAVRRSVLHPLLCAELQVPTSLHTIWLKHALRDMMFSKGVGPNLMRPTRFVTAACVARARTQVVVGMPSDNPGLESLRLAPLSGALHNSLMSLHGCDELCAKRFMADLLPHRDAVAILNRRQEIGRLLKTHLENYTCELEIEEAMESFQKELQTCRARMLQEMEAASLLYRGITRADHLLQIDGEATYWFEYPRDFRQFPLVLNEIALELDIMGQEVVMLTQQLKQAQDAFTDDEKARNTAACAVEAARVKLQGARSSLVQLAESGNLAQVRTFVEALSWHNRRETLNAADAAGVPPLHAACGSGHHEVVAYLLDQKANPRAFDLNGWHAMHWAIRGPNDRWRATCTAIYKCDPESIYAQGSTMAHHHSHGKTPLHTASFLGLNDRCTWLLDKKHRLLVYSTRRMKDGSLYETPLLQAALEGHTTTLELLMNYVPRKDKDTVALNLMVQVILGGNADSARKFISPGWFGDLWERAVTLARNAALDKAIVDKFVDLISKGNKKEEKKNK